MPSAPCSQMLETREISRVMNLRCWPGDQRRYSPGAGHREVIMRAVNRSFVAAGLLGAVVLAVPASPVGADRPKPPVPELVWGSCGEDFPAAECAVATVPLDYDNLRAGTRPRSPSPRIPASNPANRVGSVFINPGGPGGSGVGLALFGFGEFLAENLDGRFDVVGFDHAASASPIRCTALTARTSCSSSSTRKVWCSRTSASTAARSSTSPVASAPSASTTSGASRST